MSDPKKAFGPSALATPANAITVARLVAGPVFAVVIAELRRPTWWMFALWVILAASDGADGWLARWHGTTRSGAFLDPLADKFLVLGALAALADHNTVSWVAVVLIAAREIAMSIFRSRVGRRGVSIPARPSAKLKTFVQDLVVAFALAPLIANGHGIIVSATMWCAVALTILSGLAYYRDARHGTGKGARENDSLLHRHMARG